MLEELNMDKKSANRASQPPSRYAVVDSKKNNEASHKPWPRNNKKRENSNYPPKNEQYRRNVPAQRGRGQVDSKTKFRNRSHFSVGGMEITGLDDPELELESMLVPGGKKQNINHLLNFKMPVRQTTTLRTGCMLHRQTLHRTAHRHEKDLYLRAYCQFVVKDGHEFNENFYDPDTPVKWEKIEEVVVRGTGRSECPICLGIPVAGRIGHCGHIYCWPCALHYADIHEKNNPPCPVCATPLYVYDMKPARMIQWNSSFTEVTMRLVRRLRGTTIVELAPPRDQITDSATPSLSLDALPTAPFCKWFTATNSQICDILERERKEINDQILAEIDTTEVVYMDKALELLKNKEKLLCSNLDKNDASVDAKITNDDNIKIANDDNITVQSDGIKIDWFDEPKSTECLESIQNKTSNLNLEEASILDCESIENASIEQGSETDDASVKDSISLSEQEELEKFDLTEIDKEKQARYFYFYQAEDGQPVFLHRMNLRVVAASWGAIVAAPPVLRGRLLARETLSLDEQTKKHMPYTAHLPLHCSFDIVELDLQPPYVTQEALNLFSEDLKRRARQRAKLLREEQRRERAYSLSLEGPPRPDITSEVSFPPAASTLPPLSDAPVASSSYTGPSFAQMASTSGQWRVRKSSPSPPPVAPTSEVDVSAPRQLSLADAFLAAATKTPATKKNKKKHKVLFSNVMPRAT